MKKSILGLAFAAISFLGKSQSALPLLNFESGNRNIETGNCWAFGSVSYSNLEFRIAGFWSGRTNQLTNPATTACWIKTPWILPSSGNITLKARLENSSGTTRGIVITYIPYDINVASVHKEGTGTQFYTYTFPTPHNINVQTITTSMPSAIAGSNQPYKILISFVGTGGNSRAFVDDISIPGTYTANPLNGCLPLVQVQDKDNDGVSDNDDAFPDDADRAYIQTIPGASRSTLMFEDLWPSRGDYDFNDLVTTYEAKAITNADNNVVDVIVNLQLRAIGASYNSGMAIQFDGLDPKAIASVKGNAIESAKWVSLNENGTEAGQKDANVILFDQCYRLLSATEGSGVNTNPKGPFSKPVDLEITISFDVKERKTELKDLQLNPYIIVNQDREKEIHLADFKPSSLASEKLFGTGADNTNPEKGIYYKTKENLPFAIKVEGIIPHMSEKEDMLNGYPKLADWAKSEGREFADWYSSEKGYRQDKFLIYLEGLK